MNLIVQAGIMANTNKSGEKTPPKTNQYQVSWYSESEMSLMIITVKTTREHNSKHPKKNPIQ
jgi:hypothetical protein